MIKHVTYRTKPYRDWGSCEYVLNRFMESYSDKELYYRFRPECIWDWKWKQGYRIVRGRVRFSYED